MVTDTINTKISYLRGLALTLFFIRVYPDTTHLYIFTINWLACVMGKLPFDDHVCHSASIPIITVILNRFYHGVSTHTCDFFCSWISRNCSAYPGG